MNAWSETILLRSCDSNNILRSLSSGTHHCRANANVSRREDFPALTKSEPISFNLNTGRKTRLRSLVSCQMPSDINQPPRGSSNHRKAKKGNKVSDYPHLDSERRSMPQSVEPASITPKDAHHAKLVFRSTQSVPHSHADDEGFVDSAVESSSGLVTVTEQLGESAHVAISVRESGQSERPRVTTTPDVSSADVTVFGSPDVPRLWEAGGKTESGILSNDTDALVSSSPSPELIGELDKDDMEGTDLLHLISNSLDRFNAIVHPDDLSCSTSGLGSSADGACSSGGAAVDDLGCVNDFGSSGFGSLNDHSYSGPSMLGQLAETEISVPWLTPQCSISCPTGCDSMSSGDTLLMNSHSPTTVDVKHNSMPPSLLPLDTDVYMGELKSASNTETSQHMLSLPSSFCALASTLLDAEHVTNQVKGETSLGSMVPKTSTAEGNHLNPPPGFTPNWTNLLLTQSCQPHDDGDNNSSCRRRESVLVALQESGAIRSDSISRSSEWFRSNTSISSSWTRSDNGVDYSNLLTGNFSPDANSNTPSVLRPCPYSRPNAIGSGRCRLFSSCLPSEVEGNTELSGVFPGLELPLVPFVNSNRYAEYSTSEMNVANLQKEFSEGLRFLTPASSSTFGSRPTGIPDTSSYPSAQSDLHNPPGTVHPNLSLSSGTNLSGAPSHHFLSPGSIPTPGLGRQVLPKLSALKGGSGGLKLQDSLRAMRPSPREYSTATALFRRPTEFPFPRTQQRHSSMSNPQTSRQHATGPSVARLANSAVPTRAGPTPEPGEQLANNGKPVVAKWRRACSFYLRGHCKKEDCEFAHDLTKVTCKFWEMGECFKGATCPFLHGYPPELNNTE